MSELRRLYEHVVFYGLLAIFGMESFLVSLSAACLYPILPRRFGALLGQSMIMAGFRHFLALMQASGILRCDLTALDGMRMDGNIIIVANHPSLLDAVLIISRLPRVVCIMKAAIWNNWFLGGGARLAGYIRNDSPRNMIRLSVASLQTPQQLLIFPEGTRTIGAELNGFKSGFGLIAKLAAVPVQMVFIESNTPFLGKGWPFFKKPDFPLVYRIRLGERRFVGDDVPAFVAELERLFRQECDVGKTPTAPESSQ
jgi:1-acyl-sn-glycerol-3-phosphate acyltransferase